MKRNSLRGLAAALIATVALCAMEALAQSAPAPKAPAAKAPAAPAHKTVVDTVGTAPKEGARQLQLSTKAWTGDFDQMLERRMIRMDIPYSRTLYYNDKGRERGLAADLARDFERYVNQKYAKQLGKRPLTVYIVPTTRDKLLTNLTDGKSDISAGNLTVTAEREKVVEFYAPKDRKPVSEVLVTGPGAPEIANLDAVSGKTVHVRKTSSYHESLAALNAKFKAAGKPEVQLVIVPDALEDEDMLEMVNVGMMPAIVVDDWKAALWAQALPKVKVRNDIVLHEGGVIGWAHRKNSPQLEAALADFYTNFVKKQGVLDYRRAQQMKRVKGLRDAGTSAEQKKFLDTLALFRKYGDQYNFDPLMLAAQGYQESTLDQNAKSPVGAIGVMQIMPATGEGLKVGDIHQIEANIHGGAKYMDQLMTKYFPDAKFSESNRPLFAFASYNCGPGNVSKARKIAAERGLDPDKWFNNVEIVIAEKIGIETTTYVRNIYKYYVAYRLMLDAADAAAKAKAAVVPAAAPAPAPATK